jgi:hypothetical protein
VSRRLLLLACWAAVAAGWVANIWTEDAVSPNAHGVINGATICVTIGSMLVTWTILYRPIRAPDRPMYYRMLEAITRGVLAAESAKSAPQQQPGNAATETKAAIREAA